jgi:hypothetical protein
LEINILDLNGDQFGVLTGIRNSMSNVPNDCFTLFRQVYAKYMTAIIDDPTSVISWKKFILLPVVLLISPEQERGNAILKQRIRQISACLLADDWSSFTIESLSKRPSKGFSSSHPDCSNDRYDELTHRYVRAGELSKAMSLLNGDSHSNPPSQSTLQTLKKKFPSHSDIDSTRSAQIRARAATFSLPPQIEKYTISPDALRKRLRKSKNLVHHGIDKLRYEHLFALTGLSNPKPSDLETSVTTLLATIITYIANGNIPSELASFFQDNEVSAVGFKLRPVCVCGVLRKLGASEGFQASMPFNKEHFKGTNLAFEPSGPEQIVHSMQTALQVFPSRDSFFADGINAFNSCVREEAFEQIMDNHPRPFPHIRAMYLNSSVVWYYGLSDQIHPIDCEIGAQQGDVWGTWIFCMALQPFFKSIQTDLGEDGLALFYVDDSNFCATHHAMLRTIASLKQRGPKYGYYLNPDNGVYLIGKCDSNEEALERKMNLIELGLNPAIIRLHPDNEPVGADAAAHYGGKVLGSFVGSLEYIQSQLSLKLTEFLSPMKNLKKCNYIQDKYLLLRFCFSRKLTYLMRTTPPHLLHQLTTSFDSMRKEILCSILNLPSLSDQTWFQSRLNVKDSGLGLGFLSEILFSAYSASLIVAFPLLQQLFPSSDILKLPISSPLFGILPLLDPHIPNITIDQLLQFPTLNQDSLQSILTEHILKSSTDAFHCPDEGNILFSSWISSCRNDFSGAWLEAIPSSLSYTFTNLEYRHALLFRLFLPLPLITPGEYCHCKSRPPLDLTGHHLSHGCRESNIRTENHDELKREISSLLSYGGFAVMIEEQHCFASISETRRKPDVSVRGWGPRGSNYKHKKLILDVGITQALLGSRSGILSSTMAIATHPDCQTSAYHNQKVTKYSSLANAAHIDFLPIIFASSGRPHPKAKEFISDLSVAISDFRGIPAERLYFYITKRLSCALQKALYNSFHKKISLIHSKANGPTIHALDINDHSVLASDYINCSFGVQMDLLNFFDVDQE